MAEFTFDPFADIAGRGTTFGAVPPAAGTPVAPALSAEGAAARAAMQARVVARAAGAAPTAAVPTPAAAVSPPSWMSKAWNWTRTPLGSKIAGFGAGLTAATATGAGVVDALSTTPAEASDYANRTNLDSGSFMGNAAARGLKSLQAVGNAVPGFGTIGRVVSNISAGAPWLDNISAPDASTAPADAPSVFRRPLPGADAAGAATGAEAGDARFVFPAAEAQAQQALIPKGIFRTVDPRTGRIAYSDIATGSPGEVQMNGAGAVPSIPVPTGGADADIASRSFRPSAVSGQSGGTVNSMSAENFGALSPAQSQALSEARQAAAARGDFGAVADSYQANGGTWMGKTGAQALQEKRMTEAFNAVRTAKTVASKKAAIDFYSKMLEQETLGKTAAATVAATRAETGRKATADQAEFLIKSITAQASAGKDAAETALLVARAKGVEAAHKSGKYSLDQLIAMSAGHAIPGEKWSMPMGAMPDAKSGALPLVEAGSGRAKSVIPQAAMVEGQRYNDGKGGTYTWKDGKKVPDK